MKKILYPNFNPELTFLGGQAFNWIKDKGFYYGVFSDRVLKIKYEKDYLFWESSLGENDEEFVKELFDVNLNYSKVIEEISKDDAVRKSIELFPGLRILKQPFEQTLISFVISQNSNIPKIKSSLLKLSHKVGRKVLFDGKEFYLFPSIEEISKLSLEDLISTGIGYRAKYIEKICKYLCHSGHSESDLSSEALAKGEDPESRASQNLALNLPWIPDKSYGFSGMTKGLQEAREFLINLHGIGEKVADCILVFGLGFKEITPIDLWARRAFVATYSLDPKIKYPELLSLIQNKFGENTAYAGQFLFEYFRVNNLK